MNFKIGKALKVGFTYYKEIGFIIDLIIKLAQSPMRFKQCICWWGKKTKETSLQISVNTGYLLEILLSNLYLIPAYTHADKCTQALTCTGWKHTCQFLIWRFFTQHATFGGSRASLLCFFESCFFHTLFPLGQHFVKTPKPLELIYSIFLFSL